MYKLIDYKNEWVIIIKTARVQHVIYSKIDYTWMIGEFYRVDNEDKIIATSKNLEELIEIAMMYIL